MLSIGKLGLGQADYYLDSVAQGGEDYYMGAGEAPGEWGGGGCEDLGLSGVVDPEALRRLSAQDPRTGDALPRPAGSRGPRTPGYDFTFSAPKSVSLLFALGDERVSDVVRGAHEAAVGSALAYLEQRVAVARRGRTGSDRQTAKGLVAARFRHRTSRAGDPQLHTHVLVANVVRAPDGQWSGADVRAGYREARTAGFLYQAELRGHLTQELGLRWRAVHNGTAEIVGVPQRVLRAFSRRRAEIVAHLAEIDGESKQAGQIAALATRKAKDYSVAPESLTDGWLQRATRLGFGPRQLEAVLERSHGRSATVAELSAATIDMAGRRASLRGRARSIGPTWCGRGVSGYRKARRCQRSRTSRNGSSHQIARWHWLTRSSQSALPRMARSPRGIARRSCSQPNSERSPARSLATSAAPRVSTRRSSSACSAAGRGRCLESRR